MTDETSVSGGSTTLIGAHQIALDIEKQPVTTELQGRLVDIEHSVVEDDPRRWSSRRKVRSTNYGILHLLMQLQWVILVIVSVASMVAGLAANIQNRTFSAFVWVVFFIFCFAAANQNIEQTLNASPSQISLSLSFFILVQGNFPFLWSAISEIKGRKVRSLISV